MYLLATNLGPLNEHGHPSYSTSHLYEAANKADRAYIEARHDRVSRVTAQTAHRWVRDGGIHSTGLWIDWDGRIRKSNTND